MEIPADTIEDPRVVAALIELLARDADAEVRFHAAHALGEMESEDAIDALVDAMLNDPEARVRKASAWALAEIESPLTAAPLLQAARDGDAEVRRSALFALAEIEDPAALSGLVAALADPDSEVRARAAFAIGEIRTGHRSARAGAASLRFRRGGPPLRPLRPRRDRRPRYRGGRLRPCSTTATRRSGQGRSTS